MYLRWRGIDLEAVRSEPSLADPSTLPEDPQDPTDGAVAPDGGWMDEAAAEDPTADDDPSDAAAGDTETDRWGAEAFLDDIDSSAYGTTPESLRQGLDVVSSAETVWVSPGVPFIVPTFVGLLLALTAGDVLFWALQAVGLVAL
jgi:preflagellin peptidase FlaK